MITREEVNRLFDAAVSMATEMKMQASDFQRIHKNRELPIPASNYTKALGNDIIIRVLAAMLVYQKENI